MEWFIVITDISQTLTLWLIAAWIIFHERNHQ